MRVREAYLAHTTEPAGGRLYIAEKVAKDKEKGTSLKTLEGIFLQAIRLQRHGVLRKLWKLQTISRHAIGSWFIRRRIQKRVGLLVPIAIAFSPTMRCNLSCAGCYARDYPRGGELSPEAIDDMLESAERMGVFLFVITGGEPLMRDGILEIFQRHKRLLFLLITNGTLMGEKTARMIARAGNIMPVVSLEGSREQTDVRRGNGIYSRTERAMRYLQDAGATFGFSAMVTRDNFETLSSDRFIEEMVDRGCALGFYTEYVPIGSAAQWEMVLEDEEREQFRERILELRRSKPIMVVHLPDDEYGPDGRCKAVMGGCVHINAQGYVEPCPFTHFASDNIREKGLDEVFRSQFLARIRSSDAVLRRGHLGCALLENKEILQDIAAETGAKPTDAEHRA
jgi:MoaA/NifB/PqqE/SkfB family radical SAM enzyme